MIRTRLYGRAAWYVAFISAVIWSYASLRRPAEAAERPALNILLFMSLAYISTVWGQSVVGVSVYSPMNDTLVIPEDDIAPALETYPKPLKVDVALVFVPFTIPDSMN